MGDVALMALQARGKVRRFIQAKLMTPDTEGLLAKRRGECNRCGACCQMLSRCPFLAAAAEGPYPCRVHERRFARCRLFPLHAADLREVEQCSYTFEPESASEPVTAGSALFEK